MRDFIKLPYQLYGRDKVWVPPLLGEQRKQFSQKTNPFLEHCQRQLFLLKEKGRVIGRIAAFIDTLANEFWKEQVGLFGYFECIPDKTASNMLLEAAKKWLIEQECSTMRGPWSFVSQEFGMVVEGFEPSPVIMAPYNPPYYKEHLEDIGLKKAKDLLCWQISMVDGYRIPQRIVKLTDAVAERYGITVRKLNIKNYDEEIQTILELSNISLIQNWGYSPATESEAEDMAKEMKRIIQPKGVLFAEDKNGRPIGFIIALPDLNSLLKGLNGRLFPFGFVKLLWGIPRLRRYRLFALGVIPKFQRKAVDSLLYRALYESLFSQDLWIEVNYVLEDNWPMINAIKKLEATPSRRYRVYEMEIN
jgi:ribosomal protein S18 acetylase RimI-like enzyme